MGQRRDSGVAGDASARYTLAHYTGSTLVAASLWDVGGWPPVVGFVAAVTLVALVVALGLPPGRTRH